MSIVAPLFSLLTSPSVTHNIKWLPCSLETNLARKNERNVHMKV
jgi:hypothetical protein